MSPKTEAAISLLQANLHSSLTVTQIAESVGLTRSRLSHLFKTQVGTSPMQYLKSARLEKARELLETSLMSVKEIASEIGYNDCTRF
ncbi:MAG: helix-turn-helix domain-containing protein, partial [Blastocatellia bacterium]